MYGNKNAFCYYYLQIGILFCKKKELPTLKLKKKWMNFSSDYYQIKNIFILHSAFSLLLLLLFHEGINKKKKKKRRKKKSESFFHLFRKVI